MLLTDYTTYDEVRATLGVSAEELEDSTLALEVYARGLLVELEQIDEALPDQFVTVAGTSEAGRTETEQRFFDAVKLFAPYAVGAQLASSLPLFSPKMITDGKASVTRDSSAPYKESIKECRARYERYQLLLRDRFAALQSSTATVTTRPFFAAVSPNSDPVTGS